MGIGASTHISVVAGASNFGASYNFNDIGVAELLIDAAGGHVTTYSASMLDCTVFSGCIVGMLSFGHLGDRFGRRHAMAMALGIAVLGSLMSGLSAGEIEKSLIVWRVVLGLGIGGVYPLSAALAYEAAPDAEDEVKDSAASSDGRNPELQVARANFWQCISQTILYCFALVLLAMPVSDAAVWRLLLAAGAAPFALAAGSLAAGGLQSESTDFRSAARTRGTVVSADDFRARVVAGGHVCSLVPASACWALYNFVAFGFSVYAPEILDAVLGGLSLRQNLQLNAAASLFTVIGGFTSLLLVRAHGSRLAVAGGAAVMGVSSALVGVACFDTCASTVLVLSLMSFARFGCALRLIVRACVCGAVRCGAVAVRRAALRCAVLCCAALRCCARLCLPRDAVSPFGIAQVSIARHSRVHAAERALSGRYTRRLPRRRRRRRQSRSRDRHLHVSDHDCPNWRWSGVPYRRRFLHTAAVHLTRFCPAFYKRRGGDRKPWGAEHGFVGPCQVITQ